MKGKFSLYSINILSSVKSFFSPYPSYTPRGRDSFSTSDISPPSPRSRYSLSLALSIGLSLCMISKKWHHLRVIHFEIRRAPRVSVTIRIRVNAPGPQTHQTSCISCISTSSIILSGKFAKSSHFGMMIFSWLIVLSRIKRAISADTGFMKSIFDTGMYIMKVCSYYFLEELSKDNLH